MTDYGTLESLVTQRKEVKADRPTCPYCESTWVAASAPMSTLVGGVVVDGVAHDPNHHWVSCVCWRCSKKFTWEYQEGYQWYTHEGRALRGICVCFEAYVYTCSKCGGDVMQDHRAPSGGPLHACKPDKPLGDRKVYSDALLPEVDVFLLKTEKGIPQYREFWKCGGCGEEVQIDIGADKEPDPNWGKSRKLKTGWTTEVGPGLIYAPYVPRFKDASPEEKK